MDPALDKLLAWRWLAPAAPPASTRLIGFDARQAAMLLGDVVGRDTRLAMRTMWLVDADAAGAAAMAPPAGGELPDVLVVIGLVRNLRPWRAAIESYRARRAYGLLPAATPRVVVPLQDRRGLRHGLKLHRPGRRLGRMALRFAAVMTALGLSRPLFRRRLCIAARAATDMAPRGMQHAGLPAVPSGNVDFALYLGTADADRRTVVLPIGDAAPSRILKVAATPPAFATLAREADVLLALASTAVADRVPRRLLYESTDTEAVLHLEYRKRCHTAPRRLQRAVVEFLADLANINGRDVPFGEWLSMSGIDAAVLQPEARLLLAALSAAAVPLRLHRVHGDFTPWNCGFTASGLLVFDWDASLPHGLALADAANFVLAPLILVGGAAGSAARVDAVAHRALRLATAVAERNALPPARVGAQLGAMLLLPDPRLDGPLRRQLQAHFAALLSHPYQQVNARRRVPLRTAAATVRP